MIDFSEKNITHLNDVIESLINILLNDGNRIFYIDFLNQIQLSATKHDEKIFLEKVLNPTLFGGAGALWEIWIEDKIIMKKFHKEFCKFIDVLKLMGINNDRVDQIRNGFKFE